MSLPPLSPVHPIDELFTSYIGKPFGVRHLLLLEVVPVCQSFNDQNHPNFQLKSIHSQCLVFPSAVFAAINQNLSQPVLLAKQVKFFKFS